MIVVTEKNADETEDKEHKRRVDDPRIGMREKY